MENEFIFFAALPRFLPDNRGENSTSHTQRFSTLHWTKDRWSGGAQLFCPGERNGWVTVEVPVREAGLHAVEVYFTQAADYGMVEVEIDGKRVGEPFNGYHDGVVPSGKVLVGEMDLAVGTRQMTFRCREKDPKSSNYFFGIDCVRLIAH